MWNALMNAGVYVNLALPPGTPDGSCLLRCSLSAAHTPAHVQRVCEVFGQAHHALTAWQDTQSPAAEGRRGTGPQRTRAAAAATHAEGAQAVEPPEPQRRDERQRRVAGESGEGRV